MIDPDLIQKTAARESARLQALDRQARADAGGVIAVVVFFAAIVANIVGQLWPVWVGA